MFNVIKTKDYVKDILSIQFSEAMISSNKALTTSKLQSEEDIKDVIRDKVYSDAHNFIEENVRQVSISLEAAWKNLVSSLFAQANNNHRMSRADIIPMA